MAKKPDNAPVSPPDDFESPPPPRAGFGRFLRDIVLILAIGGGAMFFYQRQVKTREAVEEIANNARTKSKKNDLGALQEAEKLFQEALALDPSDGRVEAALAEVYLFEHATHGLDTLAKASQLASAAVAKDVQSPTRFALEAYLKILNGQPEAAEKLVKDLLDQEKSSPALAHALGWALMERGDTIESGRIMQSASDADFSAVAYRITLAEGAHRAGLEKTAIKHLDGILRPNINPDHDLARAYLAALRLQTYGSLTSPMNLLKEFEESTRPKSARTEAFAEWAKAELALALGQVGPALERIAAAKQKLPDYPPFLGLEARAALAQGKPDDAVALYEKAIALKPLYRGLKWDLARLKSSRGDDAALTLLDELEKTHQGVKGPDFEIFRGKHALTKDNLEAAKAHFTQAAELGDDAEILLGLARVAFVEETKKGKGADLDKVAEPLQRAMDAQKNFPEAQEFYGEVNLWNYLVEGAQGAFVEAEQQYKKMKRPIPEVLAFYDRVIKRLGDAKDGSVRKKAEELAGEWEKKKKEFLASLTQ